MSIRERFLIGIYLAASSFWLLWLYKKLLIYLSCAALIFFFMQVFLYNLPLFGFVGDEFSLLIALQGLHYSITVSRWFYQVAVVVASFFYIFMLTVFHLGLIRHTLAIVHGTVSISVKRIITDTLKEWRTIVSWSLLFIMLHLAMRFITVSQLSMPYMVKVISIVAAYSLMFVWSTLTFLALPVIAAENQGVLDAIKRSVVLVSKVFVELVGAQCWVMILCLLGIVPLVMLMNACSSPTSLSIIFILISWLVIVASYLVLSAQTVIKTLLYQRAIQITYR